MDDTFVEIENRYKSSSFYEFGMLDISYKLDQWNPMVFIQIGHYDAEEVIDISFEEVYYHGVMDEGFIYMHDEDEWETGIFIAKAKNSQLISWLASYTLLGVEHQVKLERLNHYRVFTQDHFVEIVTTQKPKFALKKKI